MARKGKKLNINIGKDYAGSSRFVVDLKQRYQESSDPVVKTSSGRRGAKWQNSFNFKKDKIGFWKRFRNKDESEMIFFPLLKKIIRSLPKAMTGLWRVGQSLDPAVGKRNRFNLRSGLRKIRWPSMRFFRFNKKKKSKSEESVSANYQSVRREIFRQNSSRRIFSLIFVLILIIIPFKILSYFNVLENSSRIIVSSREAFNNFFSASQSIGSLQFDQASSDFIEAGNSLNRVQSEISNIDSFVLSLAAFSDNDKLRLASEGKRIIKIGLISADLGNNLSLFFDSILSNKEVDIARALENFSKYGNLALEDSQALNRELNKIKLDALPGEYQGEFVSLREKAVVLERGLAELLGVVDELELFLGIDTDKRYLLVFQNNNEMRASGGFMGSYALLDLSQGRIKNLETPSGGTYDTEAGLSVLMAAPGPLQLVNPLWHFWDSNWWYDWPSSAKNIMWFYEKSDGPTVDGVLSFTPTFFERILEITGPLDMRDEHGVIIGADNFWEVVQEIVERKPPVEEVVLAQETGQDLDHEPKKIIGDMMNEMLRVLPERLNQQSLWELLAVTEQSLAEKHIMFYFTDPKLEEKIVENNWGGVMKNSDWDYLAVINTNIAGGKTDRKIIEEIRHQALIHPDGSVTVDLEISRGHSGEKQELFTGVRNVNWLRVYVPLGSTLISASGFEQPDEIYFEDPDPSWLEHAIIKKGESQALVHYPDDTQIYDEQGKTVFANWSMVDPGETALIKLRYKLPFNVLADQQQAREAWFDKINQWSKNQEKNLLSYSLLVQKQPGSLGSKLTATLDLAPGLEVFWQYPRELEINNSELILDDYLNTDQYYGLILENKNIQ